MGCFHIKKEKKMNRSYIRLLFAEKRCEVFSILLSVGNNHDLLRSYINDKGLEKWKREMVGWFLRK